MKAASVLLARGSAELFVVRRAENLRFFGGFFVFPGGKVAPGDRHIPLSATDDLDERRVTAARELFEETGVLLARKEDGSYPRSGSVLQYLRRKMIADNMPFAAVLERLKHRIRASDFQVLGSVTPPPFVPTRFDTAFFLAALPGNQEPEVWPGELDLGEWTTAERLLGRWTSGEHLVSPPTVAILEAVRN